MNREIYKVNAGSRLYGTNTKDSDIDTVSVYMSQNLPQLLGVDSLLNNNGHFTKNGKSKQNINKEKALDKKRFNFDLFVRLLYNNQTEALESIFADNEDVVFQDKMFIPIRDNAHLFLNSQMNLVGPVCGFINSEIRDVFGKTTGSWGAERREEVKNLGYSPKNVYHCLRVGIQTLFCLETGIYTPYVDYHKETAVKVLRDAPKNLKWSQTLIEIKNGTFSLDQVERLCRDVQGEISRYHIRNEFKTSVLGTGVNIRKTEKIKAIVAEVISKEVVRLLNQS